MIESDEKTCASPSSNLLTQLRPENLRKILALAKPTRESTGVKVTKLLGSYALGFPLTNAIKEANQGALEKPSDQ